MPVTVADLVRPTDNWDLDHHLDDDNDANTRPSHRACNQIAGQQKAMRNGVDRSRARASERDDGPEFFQHDHPRDALSGPTHDGPAPPRRSPG